MDRLLDNSKDRPAIERALQTARYDANAHALHAFYEWNFFFARGADGLTWAERWERAATSGLKNDELVLLRAKRQTRVALLEIHRVLDAERIDAVDLLAPVAPTLRLHDRSLASRAVRFVRVLAWVYPLPHYWRLSGTAIIIPAMGQFGPVEIVMETIRHLDGPETEPEMRLWLAENFVRFDASLAATCRLRQMQMFSDSDLRFGKAVYELQAPFAACRDRLDEVRDTEPERLTSEESREGFAEARVWFGEIPENKHATPSGGQAVLGRVLLGQAHWRLETIGAKRLVQLRQRFEAQMGGLTRFTGERIDDLQAKSAGEKTPTDKSLVPPRLLQNPQQLAFTSSRVPAPPANMTPEAAEAELMQAADRKFLDDHVPALDHRTPREAARDPALRPRLIHLLKERVHGHDQRNLRTGREDDINWLLRELGADEIIFDPPPWRPPPEPVPSKEDEFDDEILAGGSQLPPAPPLPAEPLSLEEAARRVDAGVACFKTAADAVNSLEASGLTLINDVEELTIGWLDENEFGVTIGFVLEAVLALIPPGHQAPATSCELLERAFLANLEDFLRRMKKATPTALSAYLEECSQPHLMKLLADQIFDIFLNGEKAMRPRVEAQPVIIALVRSVIDELDRALRP
jgi:hypothetical protein